MKKVPVFFFRTAAGGEPVREWLLTLDPADRREIGGDIGLIEFGWPVGMPVCRALKDGLFEVRSQLPSGRLARVLFCIDDLGRMVLLHGFIKKTQKTPDRDLEIARKNKRLHDSRRRSAL